MTSLLHTLEMRLTRHRELSSLRYETLKSYLMCDPRLSTSLKRDEREEEVFYSLL